MRTRDVRRGALASEQGTDQDRRGSHGLAMNIAALSLRANHPHVATRDVAFNAAPFDAAQTAFLLVGVDAGPFGYARELRNAVLLKHGFSGGVQKSSFRYDDHGRLGRQSEMARCSCEA